MSVITANSTKTRTANNTREASEFDGLWINAGVLVGEGDDVKFVRLPRGIAVSDLKTKAVYASMDPDYASEVTMMNELIGLIQKKAASLAEGEDAPINLELRLYRKQEEADVVATKEVTSNLSAALFGE